MVGQSRMAGRRIAPGVTGLLLLILLFGAGLRFYGLDVQSLWNDELSSWDRSGFATLTEVFDQGVRYDVVPPGYLFLLYYSRKLTGASEVGLRLPSAMAGVLAIAMIFLWGRRLYSAREGLIAAALMAVLWCPIYYSQEARPYALLILLAMVSTYLWLPFVPPWAPTAERAAERGRCPEKRGMLSQMVFPWGYVLAAIATIYMHYYGLVLVGLQVAGALICAALRRRQGRLVILVACGVIALSFLPWLSFMKFQIGGRADKPLMLPELSVFAEFLRLLFNGSGKLIAVVALIGATATLSAAYRTLQIACPAFPGTAAASGGQIAHAPYRLLFRAISPATFLLLAWLGVPLITTYVESRLFLPIVQVRYWLICLPPTYLLVARAITRLPLRGSGQGVVACGLIAIFLAHLIVGLDYYRTPTKQQFREAARYVAQEDARQADSLIIGCVWNLNYLDYYFAGSGSSRRADVMGAAAEDTPDVAAALDARQPRAVWLICAHRSYEQAFMEFLQTRLTQTDHRAFIGADVWLFKNPQRQ